MLLCRDLIGLSLPEIGRQFGRHHTTVLAADRKVRALLGENELVQRSVDDILRQCREAATSPVESRVEGGSGASG